MKTPLTALLLLLALFTTAQKRELKPDAVYFNPQPKPLITEMQVHDYKTEITWLKQNLAEYHKTRQVAFYVSIAGAAATSAALFITDTDKQKIVFSVGTALSLTGLITFISAEKHLKNATLQPK